MSSNDPYNVYNHCEKNEFVSIQEIQNFKVDQSTLSYALRKHRPAVCPKCEAEGKHDAEGYYKWHFMGKHTHPKCGFSWYISPGAYAADQFQSTFRSSVSAGASASSDPKSDKTERYIGGIFGFLVVALYRLAFGILMIPVQAIFSLTQRKPDPSGKQ